MDQPAVSSGGKAKLSGSLLGLLRSALAPPAAAREGAELSLPNGTEAPAQLGAHAAHAADKSLAQSTVAPDCVALSSLNAAVLQLSKAGTRVCCGAVDSCQQHHIGTSCMRAKQGSSLKSLGYSWSYLAFKIGHWVPIFQLNEGLSVR
jgi:hypothetical protein